MRTRMTEVPRATRFRSGARQWLHRLQNQGVRHTITGRINTLGTHEYSE